MNIFNKLGYEINLLNCRLTPAVNVISYAYQANGDFFSFIQINNFHELHLNYVMCYLNRLKDDITIKNDYRGRRR